ncbi:metal-dependent hydrolase [Clostridium estertheticum]|uniref:metal-dependent hydrolase n=1 Tax=Clostridium estertheticum TaxID=238834 RepID=UPI001C7E1A1B|nr:metal-dependent hydrolase [Clostridium estertheticum]MBX4260101.1 metal-dependent hydrolase [Clostridium estertheticum]WLC72113.1 metal-dependent hydrolase [Clostridium estertheticum]
MNGRSHQKIAMLSYAIVATVPIINSMAIFNNKYIHVPMGISLIGIGTACLSGLIVDADSQNSKINHMNPLTSTSNKVTHHIEKVLKLLLRLLLGVGLCALIIWNSKNIIAQLSRIKFIGEYAKICTYFMSFIFLVIGITNERIYKNVPVIGFVYKKLSNIISKRSNNFKRTTMILTYIGSSLILALYNFTNLNDSSIYLICVLLICIAIFPHRSFLHSIEGVIVFTISASYVFNKLGYEYLTGCFFVGYISHIYWADIFTKEGVPILSTPRFIAELFKKIGIHNKFVYILEKIGKLKLKLPPHITTGSDAGNLFEVIYIIILFIVFLVSFNVYGGNFRII